MITYLRGINQEILYMKREVSEQLLISIISKQRKGKNAFFSSIFLLLTMTCSDHLVKFLYHNSILIHVIINFVIILNTHEMPCMCFE